MKLKILLLNDNPVVNKLVTLSAQKTSDDLEVLDNIELVTDGAYDLLVVDDTLYSSDLVANLKEKISFKKSLYICSRDAEPADEFTSIIKKPFLPTDLVELFSSIGKEASEVVLEESLEYTDLEEMSLSPDKDDLLDDLEEIDDLDLDAELSLDDDLSLDDLEDDISLDEDLNLDDLNLGDLEEKIDLDESSESVLDKDDLKEVQDLLDAADLDIDEEAKEVDNLEEELDLDLGDDLDLEEELDLDLGEPELETTELEEELDSLADLDLGDDLDLEEELDLDLGEPELATTELEEELDSLADLAIGDDLDLEEEELELEEEAVVEAVEEKIEALEEEVVEEDDLAGDDLDLEEVVFEAVEEKIEALDDLDLGEDIELEEPVIEEDDSADDLNIEDQIINAVGELSQEDLDSEISEETLLDIATSEIDSIDGLNSRDLKMAFGEEVPDLEEVEDLSLDLEEELLEEDSTDSITDIADVELDSENEGIASLKKLLKALSDKDVAASMKGMKISINIELGDN